MPIFSCSISLRAADGDLQPVRLGDLLRLVREPGRGHHAGGLVDQIARPVGGLRPPWRPSSTAASSSFVRSWAAAAAAGRGAGLRLLLVLGGRLVVVEAVDAEAASPPRRRAPPAPASADVGQREGDVGRRAAGWPSWRRAPPPAGAPRGWSFSRLPSPSRRTRSSRQLSVRVQREALLGLGLEALLGGGCQQKCRSGPCPASASAGASGLSREVANRRAE